MNSDQYGDRVISTTLSEGEVCVNLQSTLSSQPQALNFNKMDRRDFQEEIKELNIAFLMLAQQMLRNDRETAMFRLGIGDEVADLISELSGPRLVRMATSQMCLPAFRFEDANLLGLMSGEGRDPVSATLHAAILAAGKTQQE